MMMMMKKTTQPKDSADAYCWEMLEAKSESLCTMRVSLLYSLERNDNMLNSCPFSVGGDSDRLVGSVLVHIDEAETRRTMDGNY